MCKFLSLISDGNGNVLLFNWIIRKKILNGELNYEMDSHTSIANYFKVNEDMFNKYEYNPLTKIFTVDQINAKKNDSKYVEKYCKRLNFKTIIPQLNIKPIIHPFKIKNRKKIFKKDLQLLKEWASVRASVWDSVGASVRASVGDSVWASVGDSVRDSVWASVSSYFNLEKWEYIKHKKGINPFHSGIDLWNRGLVPSFDGKIWKLHGGKKGKILWSGKIK